MERRLSLKIAQVPLFKGAEQIFMGSSGGLAALNKAATTSL